MSDIDYDDFGLYTEGPWRTQQQAAFEVTDLHGYMVCRIGRQGRRRSEDRDEEVKANFELITAAPDYDVAVLAFLRPYANVGDDLLHRLASGENVAVFAPAAIDPHIAKAILAMRVALRKARGGPERRQPRTKRCSRCKDLKPHYDFVIGSARCRSCRAQVEKDRKQRQQQFREANRDDLKIYNREWRKNNNMLSSKPKINYEQRIKEAIKELKSENPSVRVTQQAVADRTKFARSTVARYWEKITGRVGANSPVYDMKAAIEQLRATDKKITQATVAELSLLSTTTVYRHWSDPEILQLRGPNISVVVKIKTAIINMTETRAPITQMGVARKAKVGRRTVRNHWTDPEIAALLQPLPCLEAVELARDIGVVSDVSE